MIVLNKREDMGCLIFFIVHNARLLLLQQ